MPDMRGRKISISTTSGFTTGITRSASSPEAQVLTHENPGSELISFTQLSRTPGLSSPNTTLTGDLGGLEIFCFILFQASADPQRAAGETSSTIRFAANLPPAR